MLHEILLRNMAVFTLHKPLGATPLQALSLLRAQHPELAREPLTYAGRLDPMAEGLLLALSGEDRFHAKSFQQLPKTYCATFALGFVSDTGDTLGMVTKNASRILCSEEECIQALHALVGKHDVAMPAYSAYKVQGKPLHVWAKAHRLHEINVPRRLMCIDAVRKSSLHVVRAQDFLVSVSDAIAKVSGDFRQQEILDRWTVVLRDVQEVVLLSCELDVASGTYIRSLAEILGDHLGTGALLYRLLRTSVGEYTLSQ